MVKYPFGCEKSRNDTSQMDIVSFDGILVGKYLKSKSLVTLRTQKHLWKTHFGHSIEQFRVWKVSWGLAFMTIREHK